MPVPPGKTEHTVVVGDTMRPPPTFPAREMKRYGPMIYIPSGQFLMGTGPDDPIHEPSQKGLESIDLPAFWIDKYPYPKQPGEFPKTRVNWFKAKKTCESLGKRLCTEQEWEKACKGPTNDRYPYGEIFDEQACYLAPISHLDL